ncbi:MAG: TraB/GumN family protein [Pseudomonadota bacterium]|nr:TraB/GumN family protein [Pseudomonadota bacterium]
MNVTKRLLAPLFAVIALAGSGSAPAKQAAPAPIATLPAVQAHPALWKVSDHDTTIYLFGTIHLLPSGIDWLNGPLSYALDHSDTLMTELPDLPPGDVAAALLRHGTLPADKSLRRMMGEKQRGQLEAALTSLGLPVSRFDRLKPWVAAATLPILQLQKAGYNLESGVENALTKRATQLGHARGGLETADFQFGQFDLLSEPQQLEYLGNVLDALPQINAEIAAMVGSWSRGDAPALAAQLNADSDSPVLAEALIFSRNRNWAGWIENRMKQPGTVFIAVGAGHLGGKGSVQDVLARHGIKAVRVQ